MIETHDTYVDAPLSNMLDAWRPEGFIADEIFPVVPVPAQSGGFFQWNRADWFRRPGSTVRAPGTEPSQVEFRVGTSTFFCTNYALGGNWTLEEISSAMMRQRYMEGKTQFVTRQMLLDYESRVSAQVINTGNVGSYATPTSGWNTTIAGESNPISDIKSGREIIRNGTGFYPNRMVIGQDVFEALKYNEQIRDLLFPHGSLPGDLPGLAQLQNLFNIEKILVGGTLYNTTADDSDTFTLAGFWEGQCLMYYAEPAPTPWSPSYGYSFRWTPEGTSPWAVTVHPWNTKARSREFDVMYYQDERLVHTDLAFLVQSVIF